MQAILIAIIVFSAAEATNGNCPPFTPQNLATVYAPAHDDLTCTRGFCRYITTYLGSSNACIDRAEICPELTSLLDPSTVVGPADNNLECPATTRCVGGQTTNGFTGNFCVKL
ncbi:unnamed protein product, partial [Mesorhabditis spiculigera]